MNSEDDSDNAKKKPANKNSTFDESQLQDQDRE